MVQHMTVDPLDKDISLLLPPLSRFKSTESKASSHSFANAISYSLHKKPAKIKPSTVHCSFKGHSFVYPASPPPPTQYSSQSHVAFRKVNQVTCFILKRLLGSTSIMISPDSPIASEIFSIKDPRPLTAHLHTHGPNSQPRVFFNDSTDSSSSNQRRDHTSDHDMTEVQTKDKTETPDSESPSKSLSKTTRTSTKKKKKKYFKRVLPGTSTTKSVNSKSDVSFDTTQDSQKRKTKRKKNTGTTPDKSLSSMAKIEGPERKLKQAPENTERRLSIKMPERRPSCSRPSYEYSPTHPVLETVYKTESNPSWSPASTKNSKEDVLQMRSLMDTGDEEKMKKLPGAPKRQVHVDVTLLNNDDWTSDGEKIAIIRQTVSRDRASRLQNKDKEVRCTNLSISMPNTREGKRPMFEENIVVPDERPATEGEGGNSWLFECKNIWSESSPNTKPAPPVETFKPRTNPVFFDVNPRVSPNQPNPTHNQPNSKTNQRYIYSMTKCVPKKSNMRTVKEGSFVLMGNSKGLM